MVTLHRLQVRVQRLITVSLPRLHLYQLVIVWTPRLKFK